MAIRANPYDFIADVRDRNLFAGRRSEIALIREELARLAAMTSAAPVVALIGERRVGKTSLLNRISELASENNILPCTISITNLMAASAGEFWYEVFQRLLSSADAAGVASITASATPVPAVPDKSTAAPAEKAIAGLSQTLNSPDRSVSRYDFFIAYATPDRRQAERLYWYLQDDSCEVFLDQEAVRLGALWQPTVREALEASRAIVVLVSTHADDAFYQQEEILRAIERTCDKARAHTVIPVILEQLPQGALSMPYGLNGLQAQDATRSGGLKRVAAELVAWLKEHQLNAK